MCSAPGAATVGPERGNVGRDLITVRGDPIALRERLEAWGARCSAHASAPEGLALLRSPAGEAFTTVLVDVSAPGAEPLSAAARAKPAAKANWKPSTTQNPAKARTAAGLGRRRKRAVVSTSQGMPTAHPVAPKTQPQAKAPAGPTRPQAHSRGAMLTQAIGPQAPG